MTADDRVLLVHPGIYDEINPHAFAPWSLLAISGHLRRLGTETFVVDLNGQDVEEGLAAAVTRFEPSAVGFTTKLGQAARRFRRAVDFMTAHRPDIPVIAGGPLVSTLADSTHPVWAGVTATFEGDGEHAVADWLADGRPAGNFVGRQVDDLNQTVFDLNWPPLKDYVLPPSDWAYFGVAGLHVSSGRGCTRRCTFCYLNTHHRISRFRYMSAAATHALCDDICARFGAAGFYFVDDCFIDRSGTRLQEFCELADGRDLRRFGCDVQLPDLENVDRLSRMYDAGFRYLYVGVESAAPSVRKTLGKGSVGSRVSDLLDRALDLGLHIRASIGIGWPGETAQDMAATLRLIDAVPRLAFDAYKYTPLGGTPLGRTYAASLPAAEAVQDPYLDYSTFGKNFSSIPDHHFDIVWAELKQREQERLQAYYAGAL